MKGTTKLISFKLQTKLLKSKLEFVIVMDVHGSFSSPMSADSSSSPIVALCASCDRCRARKTKCDGNRPCGNCAAKYLKKNKLSR